ncbi:UvrD-helicase domain-containing protein [Desulfosporosinus hippei]|uniref:DNA 3'-5' helicase n=1 Tax=Desulfosporosinus hippei DSM 8344 TaxID=1121419 RepID=A0A1G8CE77_9FIRM|nr:ATP-dependent helicase [Desulfosporosinus hippei]SDH43190.1 DNA helicase-2 / ATP-dependent DNA helicase PcrA [Desulfosporosinus hippei DSM 8344]
MNSITSDSLIPIEQHFRVSAGPGAGKTYWLVKHIKNVLHNSKRLEKTRKIACITYTNIAVETILVRLGTTADQVEVSTIHSFLYKHIVKPYASFLVDDYGLNMNKLNGHNEPVVYFKKVVQWIENHPHADKLKHPYSVNQLTKLEIKKSALTRWLFSLTYKFDQQNNLKVVCDRGEAYSFDVGNPTRMYLNKKCLDVLELDLIGYKKIYWQDGIIDHEDVLFFSYQLISKYPFILTVLQAKFPYFFVDEFQDTNPIQVSTLKMIGEKETIIGVIGDESQSIYGFQGAESKQFHSFVLPNIVDYEMADNRRSTNQIIDVLNKIRVNIRQNKFRNIEGAKPIIFVGERIASLRKAKEISNDEPVYSLSRDNITSNTLKKEIEGTGFDKKLIEELSVKDKSSSSNNYRSKVVIACLKATEFAREKRFNDSIKELESIFKDINDEQERKKVALKHICLLLKRYNDFKDSSMFDFYTIIKNEIRSDISRLVSGTAKIFYEGHSYQHLALCVKIAEDVSKHKTIHKAKGDEYPNVLVVLEDENCFQFLLNPNLDDNEEHRIYYVAVSRAKERLFINTPSLPEGDQSILESMFNIIKV